MTYISDILFWISTGLLVPVIVILILLFVRAILLAGGFFGEYITMRTTSKVLTEALKDGKMDIDYIIKNIPRGDKTQINAFVSKMKDAKGNEAEINKLLNDFEVNTAAQLSLPNMLSKMGPTIGLMGTLIPMGPALVGLSTGDIASMAYNMQVAFATTVVGLCSSVIGYLVLNVRRRWYVRELSDLEYIAEKLLEENAQNKL